MYCTHCGKQLADGSKFCIFCGNPQNPAPQSVPEPQPLPVEQPVFEEQPVPVEQPVFEEQPSPVGQPEFFTEQTPEPAYMPPEANLYADPQPPKAAKTRKKPKTGPIIAIVLAAVLLIGGGLGFYFYSRQVYTKNLEAYDQAVILLKKQDYDGALEAFRELGDFQDARQQAQDLEELQEDYDNALELLEKGSFDEARKAFQKLDDYRDSENYVNFEITYQEALSYTKGDVPDYLQAANLFDSLDTYSDAADQASSCRLTLAMALLNEGNYDAAMAYAEALNAADAATLRNAYGQLCDDEAFKQAVEDALVIIWDEKNELSVAEEAQQAKEILAAYDDAYFDDAELADILDQLQAALDTMSSAAKEDSWADYYYSLYQLTKTCDEFYNNHGGLVDSDMKDLFVGVSDIYHSYYLVESSLIKWWGALGDIIADDDGYFVTYTNNTGCTFDLTYWVYFYDADDNFLEVNKERTVTVGKGDTVRISMDPDTVGDAWQTCNIDWNITIK